jgi:hypothetical protein
MKATHNTSELRRKIFIIGVDERGRKSSCKRQTPSAGNNTEPGPTDGRHAMHESRNTLVEGLDTTKASNLPTSSGLIRNRQHS